MAALSRTEYQLDTIAHLLLPMALPEPLPIWWRLSFYGMIDIDLAFEVRRFLPAVLRRAVSNMILFPAISSWEENQLFQDQADLRAWCDAQSVDSLKDFLPLLCTASPMTSSSMMNNLYARYGDTLLEVVDNLSCGYGGIKHAWLTKILLRSLARSDPQHALRLLQDRGDSILKNYGYDVWANVFLCASSFIRQQRNRSYWTTDCAEVLPSPLQRIATAFSEDNQSALLSSDQFALWLEEVNHEDLFVAAWDFVLSLSNELTTAYTHRIASVIAAKLGLPFSITLPIDRVARLWLDTPQSMPSWHVHAVTRLAQINAKMRAYILEMIYGVPKASHTRHAIAHMLAHHSGLAAWITFGIDERMTRQRFSALEHFAQYLDDAALKYAMCALADQLRRLHDISTAAHHAAHQYVLRYLKDDYDRAESTQARLRVIERATGSSAFMDGLVHAIHEACLGHDNTAFSVDV